MLSFEKLIDEASEPVDQSVGERRLHFTQDPRRVCGASQFQGDVISAIALFSHEIPFDEPVKMPFECTSRDPYLVGDCRWPHRGAFQEH